MRVWDAATGKLIWARKNFAESIVSLAFGGHDRFLAVPDNDRLRVYDANEGLELLTFKTSGRIWRAAASPDGRYLAAIGTDHTVRVWTGAAH